MASNPSVASPPAPVPAAPPAPSPAPAPPDEPRLRSASLVPSPAALRRSPPPTEERRAGAEARRATDVVAAPRQEALTEELRIDELERIDAPEPAVAPAPANSSPPPPTSAPPPPAAAPPALDASSLPPPAPVEPPLPDATSVVVARTDPTGTDAPPPTRIARPPEHAARPFSPPRVMPLPPAPEPSLVNYARYAVAFGRARWQRRRAVKQLQGEIKSDTDALDVVLGTLGREARAGGVDNRVLSGENQAISDVEHKKADLAGQIADVEQRRAEENARFEEQEREKIVKLTEVEKVHDEAERELEVLEAQRRGLRDKRKEVERRQKAYLSAAESRDVEAGNAPLGDTRSELRRIAEGHRAEAAALEPERQEYERKLGALERPIASAQSKVAAARGEVDLAKRSLADVREGHRHRLAELEAELGRKHREHDNATGEIQRRLVTLGTLINLHRVDRPEFTDLYQRIDRLREAIAARTGEIDHLTAEREAFDRTSLMRGYGVLAGAAVGVVAIIAILIAIL